MACGRRRKKSADEFNIVFAAPKEWLIHLTNGPDRLFSTGEELVHRVARLQYLLRWSSKAPSAAGVRNHELPVFSDSISTAELLHMLGFGGGPLRQTTC
jgi:hypothetical protein